MLHEQGFSLQSNAKTIGGKQHPDRDGQFRSINARARCQAAGDPVISVDAKKKEQAGQYANGADMAAAGGPGAGPRPRFPGLRKAEGDPVRDLRPGRQRRVRHARHRECQILCARGLFAARYRMFIRCLSFALSEVYMPGLCSAFPEPGIPFPAWAGTARPDFPGHSGRLLPDPPRIAWRLFPLPFNIADRSHCVTRPAAFPSVYFSRCGRGRGVRGAGCRCGPRWPRPGPRRRRPG